MMIIPQGPIRRLLASVMLVGHALTYATSLAVGAGSFGCPLAPARGNSSPVLLANMDDGVCEPMDAASCVATLGCVTAAPAIRSSNVALVVPTTLMLLGAPPAPHPGDLYQTGPPTPPPDQI